MWEATQLHIFMQDVNTNLQHQEKIKHKKSTKLLFKGLVLFHSKTASCSCSVYLKGEGREGVEAGKGSEVTGR